MIYLGHNYQKGSHVYLIWIGLIFISLAESSYSQIHDAPIIIKGYQIKRTLNYKVGAYRLYRSDSQGKALSIPFQIDEVNRYGDYVLSKGQKPNHKTSNGIFDYYDELAFMGNDVGPRNHPIEFPDKKPDAVFEIRISLNKPKKEGAVYLGVFYNSKEVRNPITYVAFDLSRHTISTSRYKYEFDPDNYLVVKSIRTTGDGENPGEPIIDSSTFFMQADLKYFLTLTANHRSVNSFLEAYKNGPIRTIVRVTFFYTFLKLNFEVGMYTEVSFFSNAVYLPAIIYSPIDGTEVLNDKSYFFYGFALSNSLSTYNLETNIPDWDENSGGLSSLFQKIKTHETYWSSLIGTNHQVFLEIKPSAKLNKLGAHPKIFTNSFSGSQALKNKDNDDILDIHQAPINLALGFDLTKFPEGDNQMSFNLYFENKKEPGQIEQFKNLSKWKYAAHRINTRGNHGAK